MELPLNVDVHCSDGRCGRSTYIILNPTTEQVTHLIVKGTRPRRIERLVAVGLIANTTPDIILLTCTKDEFAEFDPFHQTDFVLTDIPHHATDPKLTMLWPYVVPTKRVVDTKYKRIPPGELALHRGAWVRTSNGRRVGRVDEFIIDPENGHITHLVLRKGHVWDQKEVTIPISQIDHIRESTVYLKGDSQSIAGLPAVPVRRRWQ